MHFYEENIRPAPPDLPNLQAPSITPTIPQVSVIFDDAKDVFHGNDFQTFQSWRNKEANCDKRHGELLKNRFNDSTSNSLRDQLDMKDLIREQFHLLKGQIREEIQSEMLELKALARNLRKELKELKGFKNGAVSTSCQTDLLSKIDKATCVDPIIHKNRGLQTEMVSTKDMGTNTVAVEYLQEDGGYNLYKKAQEQLDAMLESEATKRKDFDPRGRFLGSSRTTEVSLVQDAFLKKYMPEKLEECRPKISPADLNGYVEFNMTNVSLAMGYHPEIDADLATPLFPPTKYHDSPYRYEDHRPLNYPRPEEDRRARNNPRLDDFNLNLTAIRKQPKLL